MAPTRDEFATWLKVEVWLSLAVVALAGLAYLFEFVRAVASTYLGGLGGLVPYVAGGWILFVAASFWYAGRLDEE